MSEFYSVPVAEVKKETPNSVSVSLKIPEALREQFSFFAGQYITIRHIIDGTELRRSYSLCSSPHEKTFRIGIKKIDGGTFSVYANSELQAGDILEVSAPKGYFVLKPDASKTQNYLAIAAGSGITPVLSILKESLSNEPQSRFTLLYGNRSKEEAMFYQELSELQEKYPTRLFIHYIFSRNRDNGALFGRIDSSIINFVLNKSSAENRFDNVFLCGPEDMIENVSETLQKSGYSDEQIRHELFTTTDEGSLEQDHSGDTQVTVFLDDEKTQFTMSQKKSVLEAALDEGIDAPYSCQGGICSTCIARLKSGSVEMRKNQILTDEELAEGFILTCQSHPTTASIVVDYDDV